MAQAQTHQAITEASGEAHHDVGFPPFATETFGAQLLWLTITFIALYALLSKVVLPQLTGILDARRESIARDLNEANTMKTRAEEAGAAYDRELSQARGAAQAMALETRSKLLAQSDAKRKVLEADLAKRLATAEEAILSKKIEAMTHMREIARDAALAIIERVTGKAPLPSAVDAALDHQGEGNVRQR